MNDIPPHVPYYLGFNMVPGIGPVRLARLIELCGSVEAAWNNATRTDMMSAGLDKRAIEGFLKARAERCLEDEAAQIIKDGIQLITIEDATYPALLGSIAVPPPLLYVRGALLETDRRALAVVGTRSPTTYGKEVTRQLVTDLVAQDVTIVSGLASGIDAVAHLTALEASGRTIGVLGNGIDIIYPATNRPLMQRMMVEGVLISDYPRTTPALASNFPPRNRIISGLTLGTVVVEAGEKSGAMITVDFALEQGRDVFAVPGSIFSQRSAGTHRLIRSGATLVTSAQDILNDLNLMTMHIETQIEMSATLPDDPIEATLLSHLTAEPQHIDLLCRVSGLPITDVSATLMMLELKGVVRQVGAMEYVRTR